jgi:dTDP-glucose 4,6-dehydratase
VLAARADRPNHDRRYLIEPAKLERELGRRPVVGFAAGLAQTVDWYAENEAWWRDVLRGKGELQVAWAGARPALKGRRYRGPARAAGYASSLRK